ncbi:MAG: 5-(carboxyamino)imidazole ribonucleotide mutase [Deltaproteobacteria bacterium TMED126]|jgi:5-(carboxyamino)imidazole ribonucleotide mutase|nr:5-(carboxyamino)imidazole ribonucleotide mutase [Deltaproteobacteria bacterium TMED126]|tara:strand:- start:11108 stop:11596 length:489 start_codon:yes stop_codon:yes gene_type:complete
MAKVAIICGSDSDLEKASEAGTVLDELGIEYELRIASAHRTPEILTAYMDEIEDRGIEVVIAAAGWAAHLPGVVASFTTLPVIGIPIDSSCLNGLDSLMSIVQMPPGIPVATMSIGKGGARNAGIYAASILGIKYPEIRESVNNFRQNLKKKVMKAAEKHNK